MSLRTRLSRLEGGPGLSVAHDVALRRRQAATILERLAGPTAAQRFLAAVALLSGDGVPLASFPPGERRRRLQALATRHGIDLEGSHP